jgi:serine/threonine-protein kinase
MGQVHLAVSRGGAGVRKLVVIKEMRGDVDGADRAMFVEEARVAVQLNHANVVHTYEVTEEEGGAVRIVMEYIQGRALSHILKKVDDFPVEARLYFVREVAEALDYVHHLTDVDGTPMGLVHRDVSPPNVMVTFDGNVKLLDFGVAKSVAATHQTASGVLKGKIPYMPPEQVLGERLDGRADLFALGGVLFELLTGKSVRNGRDDVQILRARIEGLDPSPRDVDPTVPEDLDAICRKAMARAGERYASAADFVADIDRALVARDARPTSRDIGRLMGEVFAEYRRKAGEIAKAAMLTSDDATSQTTTAQVPTASQPETFAGQTTPISTAGERRAWLVAAGAGALGVAALVGLALSRSAPTSPTAPAAHAPPPPPLEAVASATALPSSQAPEPATPVTAPATAAAAPAARKVLPAQQGHATAAPLASSVSSPPSATPVTPTPPASSGPGPSARQLLNGRPVSTAL